jgi:hypothetical protein
VFQSRSRLPGFLVSPPITSCSRLLLVRGFGFRDPSNRTVWKREPFVYQPLERLVRTLCHDSISAYSTFKMNSLFVSFSLVCALMIGFVHGFVVVPPSSMSPLTCAAVLTRHEYPDESSYHYLFNKAREYAFSDTTTAQEAKKYLQYILELESACVSGSAVGSDICDNVTELTDIVAHLRQKANQQQAAMGRCVWCLFRNTFLPHLTR